MSQIFSMDFQFLSIWAVKAVGKKFFDFAMTCLDMFVELYQIVAEYFYRSFRSIILRIKSSKSFFRVKSLRSIRAVLDSILLSLVLVKIG